MSGVGPTGVAVGASVAATGAAGKAAGALLPFTGAAFGLYLIVAVCLIVTGFVLRRVAARRG